MCGTKCCEENRRNTFMRNWSILQGSSKAQLKQALKVVRNVCQPKSGATTGKVELSWRRQLPFREMLLWV
jgi:hypothetical protein